MKKFQLSATPRVDLGKKATKALRANGGIPCVLNGGKLVELPFTGTLKPGEKIAVIDEKRGIITTDIAVRMEDVRKLIYTPDIFEIDLDINGDKRVAVMKEIQFQPVKDTVLHIDFLEVTPEKPIVMEVPVTIEGHAEGVKAQSQGSGRQDSRASRGKCRQSGSGQVIGRRRPPLRGTGAYERQERCGLRRAAYTCRTWCRSQGRVKLPERNIGRCQSLLAPPSL